MKGKEIKKKLTLTNISIVLGTIVALVSSIQFLAMPALDAYVETKIQDREEELMGEASAKVSFRTLLSQESGIPRDRVHIAYGELYIKFREMLDQMEEIQDVIDVGKDEKQIGLVFYHGRLWWRWKDGEDYRMRKKSDSSYYYVGEDDKEHKIGLR